MLNLLNYGTGVEILINILIDVAILNIIYSVIHSETGYLKVVIIYTVCLEIKQILLAGIPPFCMFVSSFSTHIFLLVFYFVLALILIKIGYKIGEKFTRVPFIIASVILKYAIIWMSGVILVSGAFLIFIICL